MTSRRWPKALLKQEPASGYLLLLDRSMILCLRLHCYHELDDAVVAEQTQRQQHQPQLVFYVQVLSLAGQLPELVGAVAVRQVYSYMRPLTLHGGDDALVAVVVVPPSSAVRQAYGAADVLPLPAVKQQEMPQLSPPRLQRRAGAFADVFVAA